MLNIEFNHLSTWMNSRESNYYCWKDFICYLNVVDNYLGFTSINYSYLHLIRLDLDNYFTIRFHRPLLFVFSSFSKILMELSNYLRKWYIYIILKINNEKSFYFKHFKKTSSNLRNFYVWSNYTFYLLHILKWIL